MTATYTFREMLLFIKDCKTFEEFQIVYDQIRDEIDAYEEWDIHLFQSSLQCFENILATKSGCKGIWGDKQICTWCLALNEIEPPHCIECGKEMGTKWFG